MRRDLFAVELQDEPFADRKNISTQEPCSRTNGISPETSVLLNVFTSRYFQSAYTT
jgi:hypothetical protein